jgi:hypothetical protein
MLKEDERKWRGANIWWSLQSIPVRDEGNDVADKISLKVRGKISRKAAVSN